VITSLLIYVYTVVLHRTRDHSFPSMICGVALFRVTLSVSGGLLADCRRVVDLWDHGWQFIQLILFT